MLLSLHNNIGSESGDTSGSGDIHNIVGAFSVSTFSLMITAPSVPGLEYTLATNRCHYEMPENKMAYTLRLNKLQFTLPDDD